MVHQIPLETRIEDARVAAVTRLREMAIFSVQMEQQISMAVKEGAIAALEYCVERERAELAEIKQRQNKRGC